MYKRRKAPKGSQSYRIDYVLTGVDQEETGPATVHYFYSDAEPDVGWSGGIELESVEVDGADILPFLPDNEQERIVDEIIEYYRSYAEDEY